MQAASRRAEREAYRRRRALQKEYEQQERQDEFERVRYEVELYENHIELLLSVHKECGTEWNWASIQTATPPAAPERDDYHERRARHALQRFKPSVWDRMFGWTESRIATLEDAIDVGQAEDDDVHREAIREFNVAFADWNNARRFATRVLSGDLNAYAEAVQETSPLSDLAVLGSAINLHSSVQQSFNLAFRSTAPSRCRRMSKCN